MDPRVRSAKGISLKGAAVVLDEAHNVADCCRDAATGEFSKDDLAAAAGELARRGMASSSVGTAARTMCDVLEGLLALIDATQMRQTGYV